jgi:GDP-L-fucose synthase
LADIIKKIVGYKGEIVYDKTKPDGTPQKFMDSSRINKLGWKPEIKLEDGIAYTYQEFLLEMKEAIIKN